MTPPVCQAPVTDRSDLSGLPGPLCDLEGSYINAAGLIYLINRYYDPATDQFLSVDPMVDQTGQPYVFTNDDPLNSTDPLGLKGAPGTTCIAKTTASCNAQVKATDAKLLAAVSQSLKFVSSHIGDISTAISIGVCLTSAGIGCAVGTGIALVFRVVQRHNEGVSFNSASNYLDAAITGLSGGLLGLTSKIGEAAVVTSRGLTITVRVHAALPDIIGWVTGQVTHSDIP